MCLRVRTVKFVDKKSVISNFQRKILWSNFFFDNTLNRIHSFVYLTIHANIHSSFWSILTEVSWTYSNFQTYGSFWDKIVPLKTKCASCRWHYKTRNKTASESVPLTEPGHSPTSRISSFTYLLFKLVQSDAIFLLHFSKQWLAKLKFTPWLSLTKNI